MIGAELAKGVDGTGDSDGMRAVERHSVMARGAQSGGRGPGGRAARAVERVDGGIARFGEEDKAIAADAGHLWFANAQEDRACNRRVHGVAAAFENVDGGLGRERVRGGAHSVGGEGSRAAGRVKVAHGESLCP